MAGIGRALSRMTKAGNKTTESSRISRGARIARTGTYVSGKDIEAARSLTELGILRRQVEEMPEGPERTARLRDIRYSERMLERRDAEQASRAGRRMEQGTRDRKAASPTLSRMSEDKPDSSYTLQRRRPAFAKGGMAKKYNKGGYANCGASMKPDGKRRK